MEFITPYIIPVLQIIWIDLLLSGDNAVVIAMACRALPPHQRRVGMILGAGTAIGLRIVFAIFITYLLGVPLLKVVGGALLLWIGVKLALGEEDAGHEVESSENLWRAVRTIAIADAVMSLDNVHFRPAALDPADHFRLDAALDDDRSLSDHHLGWRGSAGLDRGRDDRFRPLHHELAEGHQPGLDRLERGF
jgi:predicted tellurium resistance membrane protein TerC